MTKEEIALNIACDLLIGSNLYGYDYDKVFEEIMDKEGIVSSISIKEFILNNLEKLGKEYFVKDEDVVYTWNASCENCEHAYQGADPLDIIKDSKYLFHCSAGHAYGGRETVCSDWKMKEGEAE